MRGTGRVVEEETGRQRDGEMGRNGDKEMFESEKMNLVY
jgi:hypothetical protein